MQSWEKAVEQLINLLKRVGGAALVGMMVITCVDVIFRAFNRPIFGAVEIVSFMATIVLACAMPMTDHEHGHVGVDLFVRKFTPRVQAIYSGVGNLFAGTLFGLVCWQMVLYGNTVKQSGEVSMSLQFPDYILIYLVAVAFGVLSLVIFTDSVNYLKKAAGK
ncbi:MAG: TRAP transporter small permease [Desulfarculaceae bacterium]|nr:TRAP transporter small permease [Desulfarculaceae bacterium]MCF8071364.1 TRAP transporter small permease [Desulfarculaceae bacterium]MCF8101689.1 TRAP transporter small permease [Desulfarculaceae bacterium]MCF8116702.1 TRAP transporter small permease [Desulfarculaceae bacterium]